MYDNNDCKNNALNAKLEHWLQDIKCYIKKIDGKVLTPLLSIFGNPYFWNFSQPPFLPTSIGHEKKDFSHIIRDKHVNLHGIYLIKNKYPVIKQSIYD